MIRRSMIGLIGTALPLLMGCGDQSRDKSAPVGRPALAQEDVAKSTPTSDALSPEADGSQVQPKANRPEWEVSPADEPLIFDREKKSELTTYELPNNLRERLGDQIPQFAKPPTKSFTVTNQNLFISAKTSTMNFSGVLKVPGKVDEKIELTCSFDKSKNWTCDDMFPKDESIAKERRMQATVNCLDSYRCTKVGVRLYVLIDGKTESQLFQSQRFFVSQADSGDAEEGELRQEPLPSAKPKKFQGRLPSEPKFDDQLQAEPRVIEGEAEPEEKLPPGVVSYGPKDQEPEGEYLSDADLGKLLEDPNAAVEIEPPVWTPEPTKSKYSIPGIEKLQPRLGKGVPSQAFGRMNGGHLEKAAQLPSSGVGFQARRPLDQAYGTNLMMEMIQGAAKQVEKKYPGRSPFVIAAISKKNGGVLLNRSKRAHRSHQNGLDVDVVFPAKNKVVDMWEACRAGKSGICPAGAKVDSNFDSERFWLFAKALTCAEKNPVKVMFIDKQIKNHLCAYAKSLGENYNDPKSCAHRTLKAMKSSVFHHNHVHIRFRCPGNPECQDQTFDLGKGAGC